MTDDTINYTAHPPAITTSLFRINHRLGTLFAFPRSQDSAAEMFVAQWAALLGHAPGDFSIDQMVRYKKCGAAHAVHASDTGRRARGACNL